MVRGNWRCIYRKYKHIFLSISSQKLHLMQINSMRFHPASTNIGETISVEDQLTSSSNTALSFFSSSDSTINIKESISTKMKTSANKEVSTYKESATSNNMPISSKEPAEELVSSGNAASIIINDAVTTETAISSVSTGDILFFCIALYSCSYYVICRNC